MSTSIVTRFSEKNSSSDEAKNFTTITSSQNDCIFEICNWITHGKGKKKFTDYEIKIKTNSYLIQKIGIDPNSTVRRRYRDFVWLHSILNRQKIKLPQLPGKSFRVPFIPAFNKKNFEDEFIKHRCKNLENYLNKLAENPLVRANESFQLFLQEQNLNK